MSVRVSRDHHLFDGFPRLIAVFRALQSLLMPRHPPCALWSLTTRIECSRKFSKYFRISNALRCTKFRFRSCIVCLISSPASAPAPYETVTIFSRCVQSNDDHWNSYSKHHRKFTLFRLGRTLQEFASKDEHHQHSFKMPITTTELSNNNTSRETPDQL